MLSPTVFILLALTLVRGQEQFKPQAGLPLGHQRQEEYDQEEQQRYYYDQRTLQEEEEDPECAAEAMERCTDPLKVC